MLQFLNRTTEWTSQKGAAVKPLAGGLTVKNLHKHFRRSDGELVTAVDGVSLAVEQGAFCVLLGPSGCGKTTLLRCIAGLEHPDRGIIEIGDRTLYSSERDVRVEPRKRGLGMVFQTYALWPHMKVAENVAFPLTTRSRRERLSKQEIAKRTQDALEVVGIGELGTQAVGSLSGGQQQRVALARAIASGSDTILFDEPLSNVDAKVRTQLRIEIHRLQRELGFTALYVTHDQEEAMELADLLVVLNSGEIEQSGRPQDIYRAPVSRYVAEFIGTADLLEGVVAAVEDGTTLVETPIGTVHVGRNDIGAAVGEPVAIAFRAEDWLLSAFDGEPDQAAVNTWTGYIVDEGFLGASTQFLMRVAESHLRVRSAGEPHFTGGKLQMAIRPSACKLVAP